MSLQKITLNVRCKRPCKKLQRQGAQIPRNEAYISIRRIKPAPAKAGEVCSAIPILSGHMDSRALQGILRGR